MEFSEASWTQGMMVWNKMQGNIATRLLQSWPITEPGIAETANKIQEWEEATGRYTPTLLWSSTQREHHRSSEWDSFLSLYGNLHVNKVKTCTFFLFYCILVSTTKYLVFFFRSEQAKLYLVECTSIFNSATDLNINEIIKTNIVQSTNNKMQKSVI